jgi:hypothetical protein
MGGLMRRWLAVMAAAGLLLAIAPTTSAAETLGSFGTPTGASTFATGVKFSQPVTVTTSLARAELLLTFADAIGPTIVTLPAPANGASTLTHQVDPEKDGHILPNTPIVARWRLVSAADHSVTQVGPEIRIIYADDRFTWKSETGQLVTVHWYEGSDAFGKRALKIAEDAVSEASALLGVTESEPIDFYVYADETPFRDALGPGTRENVGGQANADIRTLFALIPSAQIDDAWVGVVIPHELTHLVFNTAAQNPYHFPPRWLNEGLAVYQSEGYGGSRKAEIRDGARAGTLIPLDGLTGQFPTTGDRFELAYAESVSAVDYLIRTYTKDALVQLIRSYADGRTDDEAFKAALGVDISTFGEGWLADVDAKPPIQYGPKPAAPGPVSAPATKSGLPVVPMVFALVVLVIVVAVALAAARSRSAEGRS